MREEIEDSDILDVIETLGVSAPIEEPEVKPEISSGVKKTIEPKLKSKARKKSAGPQAPIVIQMQSVWPARLIISGAPSGKEYRFERAGVLVGVDPQDVDFILSRNRKIETHGRGCCGGERERVYVQIV